MGPFETIDLNAPGGVRDYVDALSVIYRDIFPQTQHRVDWAARSWTTVEADRRERVPTRTWQSARLWRDRRLMALAAHKRAVDRKLGK